MHLSTSLFLLSSLALPSHTLSLPPSPPAPCPPSPPLSNAEIPTVTVLNGSYSGTRLQSFNQDAFLGIPFAEPPVGDLRFANPKALEGTKWDGVHEAGSYQKHCIGYGGDQIGYEQSEDCLYLNVVRPSGYEHESLPVAVWIHGGGFYMGGAPDRRYNLSFIVSNSVEINKPVIGVSIAYRLGPFGFLNGQEIASAGARNVGLKDQRLALNWINENIDAFGGDPDKVTIWGESAGAASVGFHLTAFDGRDDGLFRGAIMESGGPIFFGELKTSGDYQEMYDGVVEKVGCGNATDSVQCLRGVDFESLNKVLNTTDAADWLPALDGDFVARYGSEQLEDGAFVHVPVISGANSDEGTAFSPRGIETESDLINVINATNAWPSPVLDSLVSAYVDSNTSDYLIPASATLGGDITLPLPFGTFWRKSTAYSGDLFFIAARRLTCSTWAAAGLDTYCYRFNTIPNGTPFPIAATHFTEVAFVFNTLDGNGYAINPFEGKSQGYRDLSTLMSKSWASFVSDLDPNSWKGRRGFVEGGKEWPKYECEDPEEIVFEGNRTSFVGSDDYREVGMRVMNENWGARKHPSTKKRYSSFTALWSCGTPGTATQKFCCAQGNSLGSCCSSNFSLGYTGRAFQPGFDAIIANLTLELQAAYSPGSPSISVPAASATRDANEAQCSNGRIVSSVTENSSNNGDLGTKIGLGVGIPLGVLAAGILGWLFYIETMKKRRFATRSGVQAASAESSPPSPSITSPMVQQNTGSSAGYGFGGAYSDHPSSPGLSSATTVQEMQQPYPAAYLPKSNPYSPISPIYEAPPENTFHEMRA
ncbi:hypothetical protein VTL71DRAFT_6767 [Oculimacula yallundae]|uniref:Carboxylesterase type B domain-containing protein n=1 Tax=Oculimacula yallundae TaxID=86028 RepID=A0ABR4BXV5_9HELO